ncbi:uncharacterized protein M6B38_162165 [Iris pallida]|uniref:N-acetyltransferase domain-containing protein n=1 Tax=Iris pallida TaxID=29817 RepID=A0AAX6EZW1_IRIPA|nr:uncharacterized protein M6B38_162165 [Iris pallida]
MSIVADPPSYLRRIPVGHRVAVLRRRRFSTFISMSDGFSTKGSEKEKRGISPDRRLEPKPKLQPLQGSSSEPSDLHFDRLQPSDKECDCEHKRVFGRFIAREALIDEEIWTAAWLRAESEWEDKCHRSNVRHVDSLKRKFAEQEFHALKRRSTGQQFTGKSTCIIAVKKEEKNVKRTILSSIVGTLDISIRHFLCGETYLGERSKACSMFCKRDQRVYGYVSNLCVAKYARRQGIASNMLLLAVEAAKSYGVNEVYVQVHKDNLPAQKLYEKIGFEIVEAAVSQYLEEQKYLLCYKI